MNDSLDNFDADEPDPTIEKFDWTTGRIFGGAPGTIRRFFYDHKYDWGFKQLNNLYRYLNDLIYPKQKWMLRGVTRSWQDKPELLITVLSNFVIDFVEGERAFEVINWGEAEELTEEWNKAKADCAVAIKACYEFIKIERPKMIADIERIEHEGAFGSGDRFNWGEWNAKRVNMSYDEIYPGLTNLENKLDELETLHFTNIIKYRAELWT